MRTKLTFSFVMVAALCGQAAFGQSQPLQAVAFDKVSGAFFQQMSDGKYKKIEGMPVVSTSRPVQLKVLNINKYKYKVTISTSEYKDFTSVPPIFDSILLSFAPVDLGINKLLKLNEPEPNMLSVFGTDSPKQTTDFNEEVNKLAKLLESLGSDIKLLESLKSSPTEIKEILLAVPDPDYIPSAFPDDPKHPGNLRTADLRSDMQKYLESINKLNAEAANGENGGGIVIKTNEDSAPTQLKSAPLSLTEIANQTRSRIKARFANVQDIFDKVETSAGKIESVYTQPRSSQDVATVAFSSTNLRSLDSIKDDLEEKVANAKMAIESLQNSQAADSRLITKGSRIAEQVLSQDPFEVSSEPVMSRGDRIRFTITFTDTTTGDDEEYALTAEVQPEPTEPLPVPKLAAPKLTALQVNVDVKVVGKTKIDYSAGVFFTNLTDGNYSLDANNAIRQGSASTLQDGLGALLHVYKTSTASINPALSFGLMNSGGKTGYLLGASAIVGDDQRFIFTLGVAFKEVTRLDGYRPGDIVTGSSYTRDVFRSGMFFGITFNLRS